MENIMSQTRPAERPPQHNNPSTFFVRASSSSSSSSCIPDSLISIVPQCATSCIDDFVQNNYASASCDQRSDLAFLCTEVNDSGLTIGEGGLQCVVSDCVGSDTTDVNVYAVCAGIADAIPETAGTITATINPMAAATTSTSSSDVVTVTSTDVPTSIVSASGTPSVPSATKSVTSSVSLLTFSTTSTTIASVSINSFDSSFLSTATSQPTSVSSAVPASAQRSGSLSTPEIIGVTVAGIASAAIAIAIVFCIFCLRKRQQRKRRSNRISVDVTSPPPAPFDSSQYPTIPRSRNMAPSTYDPDRRYYAAPPPEPKRRSFWRRSIKPEEIGVAVSPEVVQHTSPASASSQKTMSMLLPTQPPMPSLWPAPLKIEPTRAHEDPSVPLPAMSSNNASNQTMREPQGSIKPNEEPQTTLLANPPRQRGPALIVTSTRSASSPAQGSGDQRNIKIRKSSRIPLTPIYDNGNFTNIPTQAYVPYSQGMGNPANGNRPYSRPYSSSVGIQNAYLPPPNMRMSRPDRGFLPQAYNYGQSRPPPSASAYYQNLQQRERTGSFHKSQTSDSTEIETDTTPEYEGDYQLGVAPRLNTGMHPLQKSISASEERSPIRDLAYPTIPRPAAVSRQADRPARPLHPPHLDSTGPGYLVPTLRDQQYVRPEQGLPPQEFTSSGSRYPTFAPTPAGASIAERRGNPIPNGTLDVRGLQIVRANERTRLRNMRLPLGVRPNAQDDVFSGSGPVYRAYNRMSKDVPPQLRQQQRQQRQQQQSQYDPSGEGSPKPQARLTPNRTVDGDLYLTVEGSM